MYLLRASQVKETQQNYEVHCNLFVIHNLVSVILQCTYNIKTTQ